MVVRKLDLEDPGKRQANAYSEKDASRIVPIPNQDLRSRTEGRVQNAKK